MGQLDGKVIVVTGAGRGLGRAFAEACAQAGAEMVVIGEINEDWGRDAAHALGEAGYETVIKLGKADLDDVLQAMRLMHEEAIRAGQIVKRARAMVDDKPIQATLIDARELLDSVQKICSTRAAAARVAVKSQVAARMVPIYADPVQLQQVGTTSASRR